MRIWCSLLASAACGCSLTSLVDVPLVACDDSQAECSENVCGPLNKAAGIDVETACEAYQYARGGGCELKARDWDGDGFVAESCADKPSRADCNDLAKDAHPGAREVCNGADDNCDGLIDDGVFVSDRAEPMGFELGEGGLSYANDGQGLALASTRPKATAIQLSAASPLEISPFYYEGKLDTETDSMLVSGCASHKGAGPAERCSFAELAAAHAGNAWLMAGVDDNGCAEGRLRVGYFEPESARLIMRGPERRSNVFRGVDIDLQGALGCSGGSDSRAQLGAVGIDLAMSDKARAETYAGLLTWIGDSVDPTMRDACGSGREANVQALGLWLETSLEKTWVNGANNGQPIALGLTRAGGAPRVISLDAASFVVAFSEASSGQVALRRVSVPKSPLYKSPYEPRATDPLELGPVHLVKGSEAADKLALALGRQRESGVCGGSGRELLVTYLDHCGGKASTQYAAMLGVGDNGDLCTLQAPLALGRASVEGKAGPAAAMHLSTPILREGSTHHKVQVGPQDASGFVVVWTALADKQTRLVATRVLDVDGEPVLDATTDLPEQLEIAPEVTQPALFAAKASAPLRVAYRTASGELELRDLGCSVR